MVEMDIGTDRGVQCVLIDDKDAALQQEAPKTLQALVCGDGVEWQVQLLLGALLTPC